MICVINNSIINDWRRIGFMILGIDNNKNQ